MNTFPSVLIVVLNWMKYEDTVNCVLSLQQLEYSNFTIYVVDNASENESFQVLNDTIRFRLRLLFNRKKIMGTQQEIN